MIFKRLVAFILDMYISVFAVIPICFILFVLGVDFVTMVPSLIWGVIFCKDCFTGRSIGKYIMKLYIIDEQTGNTPSPLKCIFRNLTCILGIIDLIPMFCLNKSIRLGEYFTKTNVVSTVTSRENKQIITRIITIFVVFIIIVAINLIIANYSSLFNLLGLLYQ